MSDFERSGSGDRAGMTYDEPARRRSPGTFFADLGDRLSRGFNSFDRPQPDDQEWEPYEEELDQPTEAVETGPPPEPSRKRFPTALHGYDRDAVEDYIDGLEHEIAQMAAKLSAQRSPTAAIDAELSRVGEETSAILKVAHEQAAEITRRARVEADRCVADAAANAVAMTEDAKRKLRQLDSETDAVWAERVRLIEDVRNVATSLFSLAEDAADRFPEDADKPSASAMRSDPKAASVPERRTAPAPEHKAPEQRTAPPEQSAAPKPAAAPESRAAAPQPAPVAAPPQAARPAATPPPGTPPPATPAAAATRPAPSPSPVAAQPPVAPHSPIAAHDQRSGHPSR